MRDPLFRQFCRYVSLNVLGMLGLSCYILADTFFVAQGLGADGLTALNLALPVYSFVSGTGLMAATGGGTRYAIFHARGEDMAARRCFTRTLRLALGLSLIFVCAGLFFSAPISWLLGARGRVHTMTASYLRLLLLFSPAFIVNNVLSAFVRNDGAPGLPMLAMLAGSGANIVLDYLFIFPLGLGITGAAAATCAAPTLGILILSARVLRGKNGFSLVRAPFKPAAAAAVAETGMSALVTEVSAGIVMMAFNGVILTLMGNTGVAAYGVVANLALVMTAVLTGVAQGVQPLVSRAFGAGHRQELGRLVRWGGRTALLLSAGICAVLVPAAGPAASLFNSAGDPLLQSTAVQGLRLYFPGFLFAGSSILTSACFSAVGSGRTAFLISACRGFALILPALFLGAALGGMTGVWLAMPAAEILTWFFALFLRRRAKVW